MGFALLSIVAITILILLFLLLILHFDIILYLSTLVFYELLSSSLLQLLITICVVVPVGFELVIFENIGKVALLDCHVVGSHITYASFLVHRSPLIHIISIHLIWSLHRVSHLFRATIG